MPYVRRHPSGEIESVHRSPQLGATEYLDGAAPEVQNFLNGGQAPDAFARLDGDFVRVLEDLIDVLLERGVVRITDFPPSAQAKIFARKDHRERHASARLRQQFAASGFVEIIDDSSFGSLGDAQGPR
jgi:hypothetical protein